MITTQIDYQNLQFMVFENNALQDNPLPVEVQRAVIKQVVKDCSESISRQLNNALALDPDVLRQSKVH